MLYGFDIYDYFVGYFYEIDFSFFFYIYMYIIIFIIDIYIYIMFIFLKFLVNYLKIIIRIIMIKILENILGKNIIL